MRARYYHPILRRFISEDPSRFDGGNNFYAFAAGNPMTYLDPFGLGPVDSGRDWWATGLGLVQGVGGIFQAISGYGVAAAVSWTGVGIPVGLVGAAVGTLGVDNAITGFTSAWTGKSHDTYFSRGLQSLGVGQDAANWIDLGVNFAGDGALYGWSKFGKVGGLADGLVEAGNAVETGQSVLGKYPDYINLANDLGAKRFSIPTDVWNKMSKAEQWAANQKFLDRMIKRGDDIILSNPVKNLDDVSGAFRQELQYLIEQGFKLSDDGARMIR